MISLFFFFLLSFLSLWLSTCDFRISWKSTKNTQEKSEKKTKKEQMHRRREQSSEAEEDWKTRSFDNTTAKMRLQDNR